MVIHRNSLFFVREVFDLIVMTISLFGSFFFIQKSPEIGKELPLIFFFAVVLWLFLARIFKVYDDFRSRNFSYEIIPFIKVVLIHSIGLIVVLFLFDHSVSRLIILYFVSTFLFLGFFQKLALRQLLNFLRKKGKNRRNLLIIGAGSVGRMFYETVSDNPHFGYNIIGFLDDKKPAMMDGEYIGPISELNNILSDIKVDNVIIALPNYAYSKIEEVISVCEKYTTRVKIIPSFFKLTTGKFNVSMFGQLPVLSLRNDRINEVQWRIIKRAFDFVFSLLVLIFILSWAVPLIGIIIKFSSPGPVFFKQERWGRDNKRFYAYKFRSMKNDCTDCDEQGNYLQARKDDPRITKIGSFLRKTSLDELPQFINVFMGSMSVVGPRPHPTPLNQQSKKDIKNYMLRHLVKPGITGWAQVHGYRGETKDKSLMQKRIDYDIWYIENWTFWLDLQIIMLTVWHIIKGDPNAY